ncbi:MAG TPA: UDP-2,3-diacylglucosamine diphosphatase LpxI [Candidatus Omnitrophota bacterium]|nr:UDP-2,3-diacylglucosamine diphosphatase LpxI [Candidatus Omnitrophota bacterium]HPS37127.1 UDP-2,3-diacylglucosamine diphosphatase LpxI [Candidatus Omnitrophota bacterium]
MKSMGIIAGNGRFPILVAEEAKRMGYRVVVCGIEQEAESALEKFSDAFCWVKIGELKRMVRFLRNEGVHEAIMAGKVEKVRFFKENVRLDLDMMKVLMKLRDHKDDSLLGGIADYLFENGVKLLDSTCLLKQFMPGPGVLGKRKPSKAVMDNIAFGFEMAQKISGADIGQTVVVKKKTVLAVEAIEGTDEAIRRGGALGRGKIIVVKVAKPNQDMRFDVPAVGLKTLEGLMETKAEAFAFEAHKTLFIGMDIFVEKANRAGIALYGVG